jgi:dTDP-4-dehydrorhamnose reductase
MDKKELLIKVLLLGSSGQVGSELNYSLKPFFNLRLVERSDINLQDFERLDSIIEQFSPDVIINAAAYTDVDKAESNPNEAFDVNANLVQHLAEMAEKKDAILIHYSTDYVFDGNLKGIHTEESRINPLSVYGKSKLLGEERIISSGCKYLIFRTCWVYSDIRKNFLLTMINAFRLKESVDVVDDQVGTPTSSKLISDLTLDCLQKIFYQDISINKVFGIYNMTARGETSWHGFAVSIFERLKSLGYKDMKTNIINPISSDEYPLPAIRPKNSILSTTKIIETFGTEILNWEHYSNHLLKKIVANAE